MIKNWIDITIIALQDLWQGFIVFVPRLVGAIIIFLIGWVIAVAVGKIVAEVLKRIKFNKIFEKGGWKTALEKAEINADPSSFIGAIFKWVLVIVFLATSVEILGLAQLTSFLTDKVLGFLPNVIVAAFIFVVAVIIADILEKIVRATVEGAKFGYGHIAGAIVRWSIWIFAAFAILNQLGIGKELVTTITQGIVWFVVLAAGLAFGIGGKDVAGELLGDLKRKMKKE